jgi:protein SCO1/2
LDRRLYLRRGTLAVADRSSNKLQEQWKDRPGLKLVSFSVDPEKIQQVLRYANRQATQRWLFLTGAKEEISRLVQEGFRLSAVALSSDGNKDSVVMHSPRFVLIDKQAEIRGYYDSRDQQALERLKKDVATLVNG